MVIYRARVPGTTHPVTFTSGVGKYVIDVVEPLKEAQLAIRIDADGKGYAAELAVPFSALAPLKPAPGLRIGFDAGVIFSDAAGQFNAAKAYWTGRRRHGARHPHRGVVLPGAVGTAGVLNSLLGAHASSRARRI